MGISPAGPGKALSLTDATSVRTVGGIRISSLSASADTEPSLGKPAACMASSSACS